MKYAVEMGSGAMIQIPSSIKIGSAIQRLIGGIHRHIDTQESRPKTNQDLIEQHKTSDLVVYTNGRSL
jgi:hypothetical protein